MIVLDLFAGPGGWDQGLKELVEECKETGKEIRIGSTIGVELDSAACLTRVAASHQTLQGDVSKLEPKMWAGSVTGLIASPPCTDFSVAGARAGFSGKSGNLVYEVMRWATLIHPQWIACEQVPAVLPIWKDFASQLQALGYNTWTGVLNAADFGVPQTRKRAILMASRDKFLPPVPTHSQNPQNVDIFGDEVLPWVTMAEALGWGLTARPSTTVVARAHDENGKRTGGPRPLDGGSGARKTYTKAAEDGTFEAKPSGIRIRTRGERDPATGGNVFSADEPSWAVTGKTRSWNFDDQEEAKRLLLNTGRDWKEGGSRDDAQKISSDQPAPSVTGQSVSWIWQRPATTVVSSFRPMIIAAPGWRTDPNESRQDAEGSVRVTVAEAGVLQTFPWDYPWQGSITRQYEQVGNAIPCGLAAAILRQLI